ncbi:MULTISPECIES: sensor histidine kinase [Acidobacteriaceae]|uniref:sensor histidine kinase n=1 Tax=Acidobacteriaceae TaxID=204434 RepID=UPI00131B8257|nr:MULTISPECIES: sensor histidine kinase [Acidobacteriaceae]MDW5266368.1 two-component regulator propeller domain-containing protein [Edaphobacter sp.]
MDRTGNDKNNGEIQGSLRSGGKNAVSGRGDVFIVFHPVVRFLFFWMLCGIVTLTVRAQDVNNLGHQSWSTENGLPQNSVHQVYQSSDGYIWIATEDGIARFDGIDFKVFNHENTAAFTSSDTCCIAEDAAGALWIGTSDGLVQYAKGNFRHYSLPDVVLSLSTDDNGGLVALTGNSLLRFDGKDFLPISLPSSATPTAVARAADGSLWVAATAGIFQYQHGHFRPVPLNPGVAAESIEAIGSLPGNGLWIRTTSGITLIQNGHQRTLQTGHDLPVTRIQSALADSRGDLWIGTNQGLFVLNLRNSNSQPQRQSALGTSSILSTFEDREGNLWVGTETSGLDILRQQNFRTVPELSDRVITAIVQASDGAMWAGTNGDGLDRWQAGKLEHYSVRNGLLSEIILALAPGASGGIWVGTPDGLNHIEGGKVTSYTSADGLPDDLIRSLLVDGDGSLWIGTRRGLAHWQNNRFTIFTQANGLKSNLIGALLEPQASGSQHDLWISTLNGLSRLRDGRISTYTTKEGLSGDVITSLAEGQHGLLWIGTKGEGLSAYWNGISASFRRSDLPQTVDSILKDDHDNLWLSSTHGITRVSASRLMSCGSSSECNPRPISYGRSDGMPTEEASAIGHPSAWKTMQGQLWFATRKGVAIADPDHLSENHIPPPVVIERFTLDDMELPLSASEQSIPPGHNSFAFQYAGLSYAAPSKVRYRYILEGFDKQWTQAGSRRIAYYTNLPARHYRFRVQAANNDGVWNEAGASLSFYVKPPFYRRPWFLLLALLCIAGIVVLLYRLRLRRLHSQFQAVLAERNRVAREIHDTLAQSFVGVSVQLELTAQLLAHSQIDAAGQQIDRTREYVRDGLAEARRSIWDLRAATAQHTLPTRLTRLAEQSSTEKLPIQLKIGGTYRPLAAAFEDEVLRIAQETLSNVSRHANATHVSIDLRYHSSRLTLSITDNGRGFEASDKTLPARGHFGLQGMRERAAQIHAQLILESAPGQGTTVKLEAPIATQKGTATNV